MSNRLALFPTGFSGWALLSASACEVVSPGITMFVFRRRGHQRHAAFMCLAKITKSEAVIVSRPQSPEDLDKDLRAKFSQIASLIRDGTTAEIVGSLHGSIPDGFSGLLNKLAPEPLRPNLYNDVFDLFERSDPRALVLTLMEGPLSASVISIVRGLDRVAIHPEIIGSLKTEQMAAALTSGLKLIRSVCSTVTDEDLRQALHKSAKDFEPAKFVEKFLLRRMDIPPGPRPLAVDDDVFELLDYGPSLLKASRRFRNCLRAKSLHVATRKTAYAVARHKDIAFEMRPLTNGKWLVVDVLGLKNEPVSSDDWQWFLHRMRERDLSMIALPSPETREVLDHLRVFDVGIFVEHHFPTEIEGDAA